MNLQAAWPRRYGMVLLLWAALGSAPWWLPRLGGYSALGSKILIYGLATMGLNILFGFTGGLSFGQAAYFGIGAYGAGMTLKYLSPSTPLAIIVGMLAGGLAAAILGPLVMRRRGIYFAMITIAIGQLFYFVAVRWNSVTGGEDGLAGFERQPIHFGHFILALDQTHFYYLVLFCFTDRRRSSCAPCSARLLATPGSPSVRTGGEWNFLACGPISTCGLRSPSLA